MTAGVGIAVCGIDYALELVYALHMPKTIPGERTRRAKLFKNGRSQAVRIPKEFEFPGDEVMLRKEGRSLIIEPVGKRSLLELLTTLQPLDEDFPVISDPPPERVEI